MAKEKAWYADSAVGTLLADLFEGKWSPELLAQLAQIPLAEAERGAFPGCPPSSGRERRFRPSPQGGVLVFAGSALRLRPRIVFAAGCGWGRA